MAIILLFVLTFFLRGALGIIICEELPAQMCSFSVASTGKRCVLEMPYTSNSGTLEFQCKTSEVFAENVAQWIENDHCVEVCGVDRKTVGISSDSLLEPRIIASVCSPPCYDNCLNIVDLYYNLALAEGAYLPDMCKAQKTMARREMSQIQSSGAACSPISAVVSNAASGPASAETYASFARASAPVGSDIFGPALPPVASVPSVWALPPLQKIPFVLAPSPLPFPSFPLPPFILAPTPVESGQLP